jgi:hypothetical protein
MADEKKPKERKKPIEPETDAAPGKKAPPAEAAAPAPTRPQTKSTKIPKLQKKNKSGLPRRQKKAQQKATATQARV